MTRKRIKQDDYRFEVWMYKGYHKDLLKVFDDLDDALNFVKKITKALSPDVDIKLYAVKNEPIIFGEREYWSRELIPWKELIGGYRRRRKS